MPRDYQIPLTIKLQCWFQNHMERYFTYYTQILKYAVTQTVRTYPKREWKSKIGFIIFNLIVIAIILLLRGREQMVEEMSIFVSVLIGFGIVALATLLWNLLLAPARLYFIEKLKTRTTWLGEQELIRREHCGVALLVDNGFPFREEHKTSSTHRIIYRVGAETIGLDSIHNVGVFLSRVTSLDRLRNCTELAALPINLRIMGSSEKTMRIDPSTYPRQFFDVIEWYPNKSQIRICYHPTGYEQFKDVNDTFNIHSKHIVLTIAAQGQNVAETISIFHLLLENSEWAWYSKEQYELMREVKENGNTNPEL